MGSGYFREEFKIFEKYVFLDWAVVSPLPLKAMNAVKELLDSMIYFTEETATAQHVKWDSLASPLRKKAAKLLNADEVEIAITGSSTTQGIQIAMEAIKSQKGENIITSDLEFPLVGAELQKWKERGVEVRVLKNRKGEFYIEDLEKLIDEKTKVVLLSSVTWVNGYKFDLDEVSKVVHEKGAYLVLDAIQHLGAMSLDTKKTNIDFIAAGGHKWLTTPLGIGILYINKRLVNELKPPFYGYMNAVEPEGGWDNFFRNVNKSPLVEFKYVPTARKFEYGGTGSYTGVVGLTASLSLINSIGIENVERKILKLKKVLIEELESIGAKILPPINERNYSGITTFNIGKTIEEDYKLVDTLNKKGIKVSGRGTSGIGGIRVSIHYPNNEEDINKLVEAIKKLKG